MPTIAENIKRIRKEKNLTQKQLGDRCGMADSAIRRYESGRARPKIDTVQKIAYALEVPLDEIYVFEKYDNNVPDDFKKFLSDFARHQSNIAITENMFKLFFEILRFLGFIIEFNGCLELRDLYEYDVEKEGIWIDGQLLKNCSYDICKTCDKRENTYYKISYDKKSIKLECKAFYSLIMNSINSISNSFSDTIHILEQLEPDTIVTQEFLENLKTTPPII